MTAPFTVPYTQLASPAPGAASAVVRAPSDGMAAKMVAGGLSCMLISAILNPMDVVKIKLQTQNQLGSVASIGTIQPAPAVAAALAAAPAKPPVSTTLVHTVSSAHSASPLHLSMYADSKYKGMTNGLLTIYKEEGYARGLMRGSGEQHTAATLHARGLLAGGGLRDSLTDSLHVCALFGLQRHSECAARGVVQQHPHGPV